MRKEIEELKLSKLILQHCIKTVAGYIILDIPELAQAIDTYYRNKNK